MTSFDYCLSPPAAMGRLRPPTTARSGLSQQIDNLTDNLLQ
ncbi:hypothetical protein QN375_06130 [Pseudomonas sp. MH9.2]|nr:hypothetical protein [Pseudomonas sp. MH9.2]MEB0025346.1 hypothetical protein [Pseudomonas sp. MH9.2]WPX69902.1 hypothetical protein RHM55_04800 [Pseudomonas sp. MH9.2]